MAAGKKGRKVQLAQYVMRGLDELRTLFDQLVTAAAHGIVDRARNREHLPAELIGPARRDQGAAPARRLDHQGPETQRGDDAVAVRKIAAPRRSSQRKLAQQCALLCDRLAQVAMT